MPDSSASHPFRTNDERCPHCGAQLQGDPIPEADRPMFGATHFSRRIGLSSWEQDRVYAWRCPDCNGEWPRANAASQRSRDPRNGEKA